MKMESRNFGYNPADMRDTGQWRLTIQIGVRGMTAVISPLDTMSGETMLLFEEQWEEDGTSLLGKIEETVYNNPRLFDDYATEIIIMTEKTIFVPDTSLEETGSEEELYNAIYKADFQDIMIDPLKDREGRNTGISALYSLTPGLPSFILRTLPGAKIKSHLGVMIEKFRNHTSEYARIYVDIREKEADIIALRGVELLSAATLSHNGASDLGYRIMLLLTGYGLKKDDVEIRLSGKREIKTELAGQLRKILNYVVFTPEPRAVTESGFPHALCIAIDKHNQATGRQKIR